MMSPCADTDARTVIKSKGKKRKLRPPSNLSIFVSRAKFGSHLGTRYAVASRGRVGKLVKSHCRWHFRRFAGHPIANSVLPSTILPALDNSTRIPDVYPIVQGTDSPVSGRREEGEGLSIPSWISNHFRLCYTLSRSRYHSILTDRLLFFDE